MIDIRLIRENSEAVKENIKKKFQDEKLVLVDTVQQLDESWRKKKHAIDELRSQRNKLSQEVNVLMKQKKKEAAADIIDKAKKVVKDIETLEQEMSTEEETINEQLMKIPNMIDESVPIGKDDTENVERRVIGKPLVPAYEIQNHAELAEGLEGLDLESARTTSGQGFYYLKGNIARLHTALLGYARDYMVEHGFIYCIPPALIRRDVVSGVMSFEEMDTMMYKIEDEDLYLIGTSEHAMIGMFKDKTLTKGDIPQCLTSYSPCFRKEKGAHGIEEKGLYRVHQFEKQEMIVICEPQDSKQWFETMLEHTIHIFKTLDIPVRVLECCSGDLGDLKVKSCDIEAWSPRQKKYFEVGSCSNLAEAQSRRLRIKINGPTGNYFAHTLNNTVLASPRALIAFMENNQTKDGSITIPKVLQPYMGGQKKITKKKA